jgi:hypothetical protein
MAGAIGTPTGGHPAKRPEPARFARFFLLPLPDPGSWWSPRGEVKGCGESTRFYRRRRLKRKPGDGTVFGRGGRGSGAPGPPVMGGGSARHAQGKTPADGAGRVLLPGQKV